MTALVWDQVGDRLYDVGVDRGVLGLSDGTPIPWNGIIGVEESQNAELKSFHIDGVKYLDELTPGDFSGKLRAYTYPDEFEQFNGIVNVGPGLSFFEQRYRRFNLSYRTKIGSDEDADLGYKLHFLYNLRANPDTQAYQTQTDSSIEPLEFSWTLTGVPVRIQQYRPMVHVEINSTQIDPEVLEDIEALVYGTDAEDARFPDMDELAGFFGYLGNLIITDHGDGTWSARGRAGYYITMLDATTFQIDHVDATYDDAVTYDVSSTYNGWEV